MQCVIAFFPYRFGAASFLHLLLGDNATSPPPPTTTATTPGVTRDRAIAAGYLVIVASQLAWAAEQTDRYHEAFPTG